jgi:hypothetical protein
MKISTEGTHDSEINERFKLGRYAILIPDRVLWDNNVTKGIKYVFITQ